MNIQDVSAAGDAAFPGLRKLTLLREEPPDCHMSDAEPLDLGTAFPGLTSLHIRWNEEGVGDLVGLKVRGSW